MSFGETSRSLDETTTMATDGVHSTGARPGTMLRGRYRLEELLVRRAETQTWRAFDERLRRSVVVHLLTAERPNKALLAAARKAAIAADYRFLRVLDATIPTVAEKADDGGIGPFIVCEYAPGQLLEDLLTAGPLSALEAAWLVREVADALIGMHAQRLHHQRLSPATVVITTDGTVKIAGFLLEAEMTPDHQTLGDPEAADVQALGRLLYATLVARWPGGAGHGLDAVEPDPTGRIPSPQHVQPSVSPSLDQLCDRILNPRDHAAPLRTVKDVSTALTRVLGTANATSDLEKRVRGPVRVAASTMVHDLPTAVAASPRAEAPLAPRPHPALRSTSSPQTQRESRKDRAPRKNRAPSAQPGNQSRRWAWVLVPLVLVGIIGGLFTGAVRLDPSTDSPPGPIAAPAAGPSEQLAVVAAKDFDPEGNGEERPDQVSRAWDGNADTSWRTMNYWEAEIGNKTGVGVIFDLGEVRQVSRVEVDLDGEGTSLDVRIPAGATDDATQTPPNSAAQWSVIGQAQRTPSATSITLEQPVKTRFVLIYLTELPSVGSEFTGGIAEARFWT